MGTAPGSRAIGITTTKSNIPNGAPQLSPSSCDLCSTSAGLSESCEGYGNQEPVSDTVAISRKAMPTEKRIFLKIALATGILSSLGGAEDVLHLAVHSPKPLQDICLQLEYTLHWRISYENPPVLASDQLVLETNPRG